MRALPHVSLAVPYWNGATYRGILHSLFSGSVINGPDVSKLRAVVAEKLGAEDAVLCGSGSLALEIALRACDVRQGAEVVIPTFCCTSVVFPILAVGGRPVLADVGADLNITAETVEAVLTEKTNAIIVPHLYGNPADIKAIIDLGRGRNIRVIDDAAQAVGATIDGRPVGSFGDAGILSFGSEKVCFGVGGGAVISWQREILNGITTINLPPALLVPTVRRVMSTIVWRRWRRWTRPLLAALSHKRSPGPDTRPSPYRNEAMANLSAVVALTLMKTLPENIAARRARVRAYRDLLGTEKRLTLIPHQPGSACLTQVARVLPEVEGHDLAVRLIEVLGSEGYEIQGSYVPIHLLSHHEPWIRRRLPYAERVWADLIELPCEPEVGLDHVERIAAIVKRVLNA